MRIETFRKALEIHGADLSRWPEQQKAEAEKLIDGDTAAREAWRNARRIDDMIMRHLNRTPDTNIAAASRVQAALRAPLPAQKGTFFSRLPAILLDWNFAPAWPRVAALASFAALGFLIGISGIDRMIEGADTTAAASTDIFTFESDSLTGLEP